MNIHLNYLEKGEGYPLILLHGNGQDGSYFVHQISYFSQYYHVYAVDFRWHGKTPRGTAPFRIRQFADDVYNFMKEHNISKAHILGFSDGGNTALIFAIRYPEMVNSLIINGANLTAEGTKPEYQIPIENTYHELLQAEELSERGKRKLALYDIMVNDPNIPIDDLKKIKSRTLVLAGTDDMIKENHTRLIYENISNSKLCFIKGTHFIAEEVPDDYNRIVREFLMN